MTVDAVLEVAANGPRYAKVAERAGSRDRVHR